MCWHHLCHSLILWALVGSCPLSLCLQDLALWAPPSTPSPGSISVLPARALPALVRVSLLPPGVQAPFLRSRSSAAPLHQCQGSPLDYSPSPCELFHLWLAVWGEPALFGLSGDASETQSCARGRWGLSGRAGSSLLCAGGYQWSFGWAKVSRAAHLSLSWKDNVGFMAV